MLYAIGKNDEYIEAVPKGVGFCPQCGEQLISRCGCINIWHWAHYRMADCDDWAEPDTKWNLNWKRLVVPEQCDVVIGKHRADIVGNGGVVINLQHGYLSVDTIQQREAYYKNLSWLINARKFADRIILRDRGSHYSFRWKQPRKTQRYADAPMFWDFGDGTLLEVKRIYDGKKCGGWGYLWSRESFIDRYLSDVLAHHARRYG